MSVEAPQQAPQPNELTVQDLGHVVTGSAVEVLAIVPFGQNVEHDIAAIGTPKTKSPDFGS
jgi:hypothetical protein